MEPLTVSKMLEITKGTLVYGRLETIGENFVKNTKQIKQGDVYVGIKGEHVDGNTLYEEALKKGASICLLEKVEIAKQIEKKYPQSSILLVEDTIKAIQQLASYKRNLYDIPVVAVTGSVGKTSTKDMIASVLSQQYQVLKTMGNYNNHIGLPLTILGLREHTALVVEMGMNHFGEIATLTKIAKPTIAIITNIGTAHIGILGSRQNILKAKLEILEGLQENGILIMNNDNDLLHTWYLKNTNYRVKTYGMTEKSNVMATNIKQTINSEFTAVTEHGNFYITVPIGGEPFIYNALCAIAVGEALGICKENIQKGIAQIELTKKRMEMITNAKGVTIINDCYNANYDSMKAGIEYLGKLQAKRRIAMLGDMLELGEYSKQLHEKVGEEIAKNNIDMLVTVGKESEYSIRKAKEMGMPMEKLVYCENTDKAIAFLEQYLEEGDVILVKASNGMKFDKIVEAIQ